MENLSFERQGHIGILKISRPSVLNALNKNLLEELLILLDLISKGQQVRALIVTGEGEKAFVAGADIKEMLHFSPMEMLRFCELGQKVANSLENAPFVTIAAVNGYALGGGFEIALSCDFIYAGKTAKFGFPEVTLGLIPGFGGTQRFSRLVGSRCAKELILTAKTLNAEEAKNLGIVNRICDSGSLMAEAHQTAESILKNPFASVLQAKRAVQQATSLGFEEGLSAERNMITVCFATEERRLKMEAFLNRKESHGH